MADQKISAMTPASAFGGADLIAMVQAGANVKGTPAQMQTFVGLNVTSGKTLAVTNTLTFSGTDSTVFTLPATTDTLVGLAATQTLANKTLTSPILTTPALGVATATSINKVAITAPATSATLTIADGKTMTASNSLTFAGTDATIMTFPATSATIARTDAANTFTGVQTFSSAMKLSGDTTGAGTTVGFGTNSPATTLTAPYTWLKFTSSDGSTVYVPAYK